MRLLLATHNDHKRREFERLLSDGAVPIELDLLEGSFRLPPEEGETFSENALGKARAAALTPEERVESARKAAKARGSTSGGSTVQRNVPVNMPCGFSQALDICRKASLLWAWRDVFAHRTILHQIVLL